MDPLNKKERTEAFVKMLLLFLFTVLIVAIPMFYAFQMPAKDMAVNSKELDRLNVLIQTNTKNDQEMLSLANAAHELVLQYAKETIEVNRSRISDRLSGILNNMEDLVRGVGKDSLKSNLYGHIVEAYSNIILKNDNVNELKAELKKAAEKAEDGGGGGAAAVKRSPADEQMIRQIKAAMSKHNGNRKDAARELDMSERKLRKKMEELGMGS